MKSKISKHRIIKEKKTEKINEWKKKLRVKGPMIKKWKKKLKCFRLLQRNLCFELNKAVNRDSDLQQYQNKLKNNGSEWKYNFFYLIKKII